MKLSVIIPTYNEEQDIVDCVASLSKQSYKDFEIIVVDDGSTDKTVELIKNVQIYKQRHQGPALARNLGAKHAKGDVLVFVDADMTFDRKFLQMLTAPIKAGHAKGTFSRDEYVENWGNVWARCWNINLNLPSKRRLPKNYPSTQKVFRAILKKEFDKVGGFSKGGYTDDYTLSDKLGYKAVAASHAFFYHRNPDSLKQVVKQAKWVAKRKYKFGIIGVVIRLIRNSLPVALIMGIVKSAAYKEPAFLVFKIIFSIATTLGIFEMLVKRKLVK
jgi:glycosyltransferase involved in cell wall biosynthesis